MFNKLHRTLKSIYNNNYVVEFWTDNNFMIMLSFYHKKSVYNGLVYISKESGQSKIDFQHHRQNKAIAAKLKTISDIIYRLYRLNNLDHAITILNNYRG